MVCNILLLSVQVVEQSLPQIYTFYLNNYLLVLFLFNLSFIMKSSLGEFCFRLLPYYPLGIVTCVLFILILFIISSCRIYEKKKGQIFLIIGGSIKHEVHMMMPFYDRMMLRKRYIIETINDMLKNTAQIVHSRHRSVSNFIMNLISALGAYCFFDNKPKALQGYCIEDTKQLSLF